MNRVAMRCLWHRTLKTIVAGGRLWAPVPKLSVLNVPVLGLSLLVFSLLATTVWVAPARAEIYRWTDEHGNVHFGDRASRANTSRPVELPPASSYQPRQPDDAVFEGAEQRRKAQQQRAEQRNRQAADRKQAALKRQQQCRNAREANRRRGRDPASGLSGLLRTNKKRQAVRERILQYCH